MKQKFLLVALIAATSVVAACSNAAPPPQPQRQPGVAAKQSSSHADHLEIHGEAPGNRVPAHYESEAHLRQLPPTLAPAQFFGRAREGYQAAQAIPKTLAQLPCYCYCDKSFGHKSLHSCFEDTHGAQCGLCIDEALLAYKLEKEQKLSPAEIRDVINQRFGSR